MKLCLYNIRTKSLQKIMVAVMATISFSYNAHAQEDITPKMPTAPEAEKSSDSSTTTKAAGPQSASDTAVEKVEVIGSRIKRINSEGPSAVKSITKEKMENSGNISVSDSLRDSNSATFGVTREASGSNAAATTNIGLRGLGETRTLILLNGHRLPKDPTTEAVDLNLIPQSAIERIEVLKDGASALYGSDALGGVINIITKKGFVGNEISTKYSTPEKKGGGSADVSILSGMAKENWDLVTVLSFTKTDKIFGKDRDITKAGLSPTGSPGSYLDAGGVWHAASACPADLVLPEETGHGNQCFFKYNEIATVRPAITQVNLLTDFNYRFNSSLKFYNRNLVVFKDIDWSYAPGSLSLIDTPTGTASVPGARKVAYRFMEAGNRDNKDTERNFSTLLGFKGNITDTWEYDISAGYNRIYRRDYAANGYLDRALVKNLISSGAFDPLAPAGSRGSISSALTDAYQTSETGLFTTDLVFTGELGQLPAGPIGAAIGGNVMNEKLTQRTDDKSDSGNVIGSSGSRDSGGRDVQSAFAEVSFPITSAFEVDLAGRVDKYSDFGTTFNPKLSAKYTLSPSTLLRASVGTGFKAPTLSELYGAASEGYVTFIDRTACAANPATCHSSQHYVYETGNRDLKEEKAVTGGLGLVYEPSAAFNLTADLWYTKLKNVVGIDYEAVTQAELNGKDLSKYGITIDRDANGAIEQITSQKLNLVEQEISGLDVSADYQIANNIWGHRLELQDDVTYLLFFKKEGFPGEDKRNVLGEWGFPNWRNSLTLGLKNETSSINVTMRTIPGQKLQDRMLDQKIKMLNEFDLAGNYKFTKDSNLIAGVKNVFNSDQPVDVNGGTGGSAVVNGDLYDINGRKFFVGYSQKF